VCRDEVHVTAVFPGAVAANITANSGVTIPIDDATAAVQTRKTTTPARAARDILHGMETAY
jgi:short-subunit dehydrogenase